MKSPLATEMGVAQELRALAADGVPLHTLCRYFNLSGKRVVILLAMHRQCWPTMPAFDGDTVVWRRYCHERLALAILGRASFTLPMLAEDAAEWCPPVPTKRA